MPRAREQEVSPAAPIMSPENLTKDIAEERKTAGNDAFAKQDYDGALRLYAQAIELDPTNHVYYSNSSLCCYNMGEFSKATEHALMCVRLDPDFIKGYLRLASAQDAIGDTAAALATVKDGLLRHPKNALLLSKRKMLFGKPKKQTKRNGSNNNNKNKGAAVAAGRGSKKSMADKEHDLSRVSVFLECAEMFSLERNYLAARACFEYVLSIQDKRLETNDPAIADTLMSMALCISENEEASSVRDYTEVLALLERCLAIRLASLGEDHEDTVTATEVTTVMRLAERVQGVPEEEARPDLERIRNWVNRKPLTT